MFANSPFSVVLVEPEIPPNTGNVARTCVATGTPLVLVGPLGFTLDDRHMRRAGLDYWKDLDLLCVDGWADVERRFPGRRMVMTSVRGEHRYDRFAYRAGDLLVFGKETAGLDASLLRQHAGATVRLPQWGPVRSLNLSNAVAVVLYEAFRQIGFDRFDHYNQKL